MYPVLDSSKEQFKRKRNDLKKKLTKFNISFNKAFTSITRISNIYRIKILPQIYITGIYNVILSHRHSELTGSTYSLDHVHFP